MVTATGLAQSTDETAKSVDSLDAADLAKNAEFSVTESLRSVPGMRVQTLGGPGSFTRIVTRGLRPQDTAITVDGLRFRDAATTQGDATPFLQDLRAARDGAHRGAAGNGVVGLRQQCDGRGRQPGDRHRAAGRWHGEIKAEGGGLGMMRGVARMGGGSRGGRTHFSAGAQSTDVLSGVDGNDRFRNHSVQGAAQFRPVSTGALSAYLWAADSFAQVNSTPFAAPARTCRRGDIVEAVPVSLDVQHRIEAGQPFSYAGANFVPNLDDPDSRRSSRFLSGALVWSQRINGRVSYRVSYHKVVTNRRFDDGPAGVRFPPRCRASRTGFAAARTPPKRESISRWRGGTPSARVRVRARELSQPASRIPARAREQGVLHRRRAARSQRLFHRPVPPARAIACKSAYPDGSRIRPSRAGIHGRRLAVRRADIPIAAAGQDRRCLGRLLRAGQRHQAARAYRKRVSRAVDLRALRQLPSRMGISLRSAIRGSGPSAPWPSTWASTSICSGKSSGSAERGSTRICRRPSLFDSSGLLVPVARSVRALVRVHQYRRRDRAGRRS